MAQSASAADPAVATLVELAPARRSRPSVWATLCKSHLAVASMVVLVIITATAFVSLVWTPYDPAAQDITNRLMPPSSDHLMGTDEYGRDVLSRLMAGARISLAVGVLAVMITIAVGVTVGLVSGYFRKLDGLIMRTIDVLASIPGLFLLLMLVSLFGRGTWRTVIFIGLTAWMPTSRLVRGEVLSLRERDFVAASVGVGAKPVWVLRKHLSINVIDVVLVQATLTVSLVILLESGLSYLGLGAQPPLASWGNMLSQGRDYMRESWWLTVFPGAAVFVTVLAFNFIGDGLRDAVDVKR
jgi:peptide/nickel transport system permease protein